MPIITFNEQDILRQTIVEPSWYRVRIDRILEVPSKSGNPLTTTVWPLEGTILFNADSGSEKFAGVPTPAGWNFNDNPNAKGFIMGFLKSLGVEPKLGQQIELKAAEGKEIDTFIDNDTYEGRVVNRINHKYRPVRPKPESVQS